MANEIISAILPSTSFKLVNTQTGDVPLRGIGIVSANIRLQSKLLRSQREDGKYIAHGRVLTPTIIDVDVIIQTIDGLETIQELMRDIEGLYTLVTRGISFINMRMASESFSQTADMTSASPIRLSFKQAFLENDARPICKQAADSSALDAGITSIYDAAADVSDFISSISNQLFSDVGGV